MEKIRDELSKLGKEIDEGKKEVNKLEGRQSELLDRLRKQFDVKTIAEAESLKDKKTKETLAVEKKIEGLFDKLKNEYAWG